MLTRENRSLSTNHAGEIPNFYGNPNGAGLPGWPLFADNETLVLEFGEEVKMTTDPYLDLYQVFDRQQGRK